PRLDGEARRNPNARRVEPPLRRLAVGVLIQIHGLGPAEPGDESRLGVVHAEERQLAGRLDQARRLFGRLETRLRAVDADEDPREDRRSRVEAWGFPVGDDGHHGPPPSWLRLRRGARASLVRASRARGSIASATGRIVPTAFPRRPPPDLAARRGRPPGPPSSLTPGGRSDQWPKVATSVVILGFSAASANRPPRTASAR